MDTTDNDEEMKRESRTNISQISNYVVVSVEARVSRWSKLKRIVWYVLLYKRKLLNQVCGNKNATHNKDLEPVHKVESQIIRSNQIKYFIDKIKVLEKNESLRKSSSFYKLDPFIGND